jgi:hypothetical protein
VGRAAVRRLRAPVLLLGCCLMVLAGAGSAVAATPELPNLVADPPTNVSLETSTTEGGLKGAGEPKLLLRFNGYIHNLGPGAVDFRGSRKSPAEAMKPFQRVYNSDGTFKEEPSSAELIYVTADGHEHWHLQRAAKYSLWNAAKTAEVAPAMKVGFCLDDSEHVEPAVGPKEAVYSDATGREFCRQHQPEATSLFEGVSAGWRDLYSSNLAFQWVDASSVLPGEYWLREDINPTGVIKEVAGAKTPGYATSPTIIPGFDALAQAVSAPAGEASTLTLTSKAWSDAATPKYTIVSAPRHGTLEASGSNQEIYRPAAGYTGADSFTYSASDPNSPFPLHPSVATVAIEVVPTGGKGLLAGDGTATYSVGDQTTAGREEAFQFTAKSSGTVEEMEFRTNGVANTGITGVVLGVLADIAGKPGEVLGQATASGEPATNSWIKATGLSTALASGTKYWLVVLPLGQSSKKLHFNAAVGSGGAGNVESKAGGLSTLTAQASWETYNQGPAGFQALGVTGAQPSVTIEGAPASMTAGTSVQLSAHVTNDSPTVTWTASAGTITTGGLYSAPSEPPAGGTTTVTATTSKGAKDQRTITITSSEPPSVTIEGAPASMTAGTSVQLSAHVTNDSPTVTWKASAGSITSGGLYTAPAEPPAGGTAVVSATTSKGAKDQRTIEIKAASSKGLLAGDATATYSVGDQTTSGRQEAFQFTAKSTGTVEELEFRTSATANTGVTGVMLGVFAEAAGKPGEVLGRATASGQPATSSWVKATGLSLPVVSGTKYWLVVLPLGSSSTKLHYNAAVASGGTGNVESVVGGLTALTAEASWETYNQGPVGFQAIGSISGAAVAVRAAPVARAARKALVARVRLTPEPARLAPRPRVMIEGAPSSVVAGTSVQLSALLANDSPRVVWEASAGSITPDGLYTAPSQTPPGGAVLLRAIGGHGARDERRIAILPVTSAKPAPAAPLPESQAGRSSSTQPLSGPQAILVAGKLIMTTSVAEAGRVGLSAYLGNRRLGGCSARTPAGRAFTCRLDLRGLSPHAPIGVWASLRAGGEIFRSGRAAGPVPPMKMPAASPLKRNGRSSSIQFICSPALHLAGIAARS